MCIASAWFGYWAVSAEIKGQVVDWGNRSGFVKRESSPARFRQYTKFTWGATGFCLVAAVGSYLFYRKLSDCV